MQNQGLQEIQPKSHTVLWISTTYPLLQSYIATVLRASEWNSKSPGESWLDLVFFFSLQFSTMMSHKLHQFLSSLQLTLHETAQPRFRQTATALNLVPGRTHVIMFGGCPKWEWEKHDQQKIAKTAVLEFGEQTHTCTILVFLFLVSVVSLLVY